MSIVEDAISRRALEAALKLFARYGFHRTSMAEIASKAGIGRATLYLRFPDKTAVFHALATSLVDEALREAAAAWRDEATLAENLEATFLARDLRLHRLLHGSPHGAELLSLDADLTRAEAQRLNEGVERLVAARAGARGRAFAGFSDAAAFARFLSVAASALKGECASEADTASTSAACARSRRAPRRVSRPASSAQGARRHQAARSTP